MRGEGDVALVDDRTDVSVFVTGGHGRELGTVTASEGPTKILGVDASVHPKVDGKGSVELAEFLARPSR